MDVDIPHALGREEVRRRLRENAHRMGDNLPGGMAEIQTNWSSEDRMGMSISAMGQMLTGHIDIFDDKVTVHMILPPALGFLKPMVEGAVRQSGQKMLEPPKS